MISRKTIDEIYNLPIETVVMKYTELKKNGANFKGDCPFHDEKTASFVVSPVKRIYKCFGCGKSGNSPIKFVQEKESLTWIEAVKNLAHAFNINIEYDESENAHKYKTHIEYCDRLAAVNAFANEIFVRDLEQSPTDAIRCSKETADKFQLGYALKSWDHLIKEAHLKGISTDALMEVGLVKKSKNVYNIFHERVMFPIFNINNLLVGFSGRSTSTETDKDKQQAKYLNTSETKLFIKGHELFGIHLAKAAIRAAGLAYVVEGNWDVVSMHEAGLENTVAPCGTALTVDQLKLLKKYCRHLVFIYDADKAGRKALITNTRTAVEQGFTVECVLLPEGLDPDQWFRDENNFINIGKRSIQEFIREMHIDALIHYATERSKNMRSVAEKTDVLAEVALLLSWLDKDAMIVEYCKDISKATTLDIKELRREAMRLKEDREQETIDQDEIPIPKGVDREDFERHGFYEMCDEKNKEKTGYWFWAGGKEKFSRVSNFIIRPLFHIYSKMDNKRLVEIENGRFKSVLDIPSKAMVGIQLFREIMYAEGNFRFDGNAAQLNKVVAMLSEKFPRCEELKTLGWQNEGFFAFSDGIFNGTWVPVNTHGIVIHKEKHFFLPAFSSIYADTREEDDLYENDRWFKYKHNAKANFEAWAVLMKRAYSTRGMFAVAFLMASLFRDMIYSKYKIFPHLFLFGEKGSGKSQLAWSLNNIYWNSQPGFNLTAGTNVGFFRKLARARNSITWFDEYSDYIDPKRFQALKSAYDGIGHEKGVMSRDNRTESTKVNSSCVISGQYLPTLDDNALFTRSMLLTFKRDDWQGKEDVSKAYNELKTMEEGGMSGVVTDIIKYRGLMEDKYTSTFQQEFTRMKDELEDYNERILRNFVTIISVVKTLQEVVKLPFTYEELYATTKAMVIEQTQQISESEALSQFWMMIEFLYRDRRINWQNNAPSNIDFKVEDKNDLRIMINRKEEHTENFAMPRKCLFIRFTKVHPLYMEMHRKQHGHNGIAMASLKTYIHSHKAFIGLTKSTSFDDGVSSAYVFDYNELGVNLEMGKMAESLPMAEASVPVSSNGVQEDLPF